MTFFTIKTILGWLILIMGAAAVISMLTVMGKQEKKMPAPKLRKIHRSAGRMFFLLMLINAIMGFRFWVISGDTPSVTDLSAVPTVSSTPDPGSTGGSLKRK